MSTKKNTKKNKVHYFDNPPTITYCGKSGLTIEITLNEKEVTCKVCLAVLKPNKKENEK